MMPADVEIPSLSKIYYTK